MKHLLVRWRGKNSMRKSQLTGFINEKSLSANHNEQFHERNIEYLILLIEKLSIK